jgi:predicted nucleic acid-binding protein
MYVLDTNIISELRRARPHGGVLAWLRSVDDRHLHLSAVSFGEIQAGIERTPTLQKPQNSKRGPIRSPRPGMCCQWMR